MGAKVLVLGGGLAAYGEGRFYEDPVPNVVLHPPAPEWHDANVRYEEAWLDAGARPEKGFRRAG